MAMLQTSLAKADHRAIGNFVWEKHPNFHNVEAVGRDLKESIKTAGLDWSVRKEQLYLNDGRTVDSFAVVREDNNEVISPYVGPEWTPVQNSTRFEWFQPYLDNKDATILSAGAIKGGQKIAIIARLDHNTKTEIQKGDEVARYLLLTDAYGGHAVKAALLIARLVCGNGMVQTSKEFKRSFRHSRKVNEHLEVAHNDVGMWQQGFDTTFEEMKFLASKDVKTPKLLENYFVKVMDYKIDEEKGDYGTRQRNTLNQLEDLFANQTYNKGNNWWTALNAVTAYYNHYAGRTTDSALDSVLYGNANNNQKIAFTEAINFANAV